MPGLKPERPQAKVPHRIWLLAVLLGVSLPAQPVRPFLWSDGLRAGALFQDERMPFRFVAPEDLVYRIWKEGIYYRLEARSYRGNGIYMAMAAMRYLRPVALQTLLEDLTEGCNPATVQVEERAELLTVHCQEKGEEAFILRVLSLQEAEDTGRLGFFELISRRRLLPADLQLQAGPEPQGRFVLP